MQSWANKKLTPDIIKLCNTHRTCNPLYQYEFYDDRMCRQFLREHFHPYILRAYDAIIPGAFKADLFRYCELYKNGGWWFDIDILSVGSIDAAIGPEVEFACPQDSAELFEGRAQYALYQAVLGCKPGHPILEVTIRKIVDRVSQAWEEWAGSAGHEYFSLTGPVLLGSAAHTYLAKEGESAYSPGSKRKGTVEIGRSTVGTGLLSISGRPIAVGHSQTGTERGKWQRMIHAAYAHLKWKSIGYIGKRGGTNASYHQHNSLMRRAKQKGGLGAWNLCR